MPVALAIGKSRERFLAQVVRDSRNDLASAMAGEGEAWDWVVVTASNERQAAAYRLQIEARLAEDKLPAGSEYLVVPDVGGKRIGSGGATLNAYAAIAGRIGLDALLSQRILMIHSGGDSKRLPQYSARGKLFAPVPHALGDGSPASIFDDLMASVAGVPSRVGAGTLVLPSDTEAVFSPLQLDLSGADAAGLSMKVPASEGAEHGVFLGDGTGLVRAFLHKLPVGELDDMGAVDGYGRVDIDTGLVWLGRPAVEALLSVVAGGGGIDVDRLAAFADPRACLNLYADFLYPMALDASLEGYLSQAPEAAFTPELERCRRELWATLSPLSMRLASLAPSLYVHFGTTWETLGLMAEEAEGFASLGWRRQVASLAPAGCAAALSNSLVEGDASVAAGSYVENARVSGGSAVAENSIVSGIDVSGRDVPANVVLHGMRRADGRWVCRAYGIQDNPKESSSAPFLGSTVDSIISRAGLSRSEVWEVAPASIWNARLHSVCDTEAEALDAALSLVRIAGGEASPGEVARWAASERESLNSSFNAADVAAEMARCGEIGDEVAVRRCEAALSARMPAAEAMRCLGSGSALERRLSTLVGRARETPFPDGPRALLAASALLRGDGSTPTAQSLEDEAYDGIRDAVEAAAREASPIAGTRPRMARGRAECFLPARVNFCGSPSDAAPYCLERGGTMIDAAVLLNGRLPIRAVAERTDDPVFELGSVDQATRRRFEDLSELRRLGDPRDPYALHKACIASVGLLDGWGSLAEFCAHAGGGVRLVTSAEVPKGSGLGTSSIIAAAACKALDELFGCEPADDLVYDQVFVAEQLMGTGGGWQDQVGGLTPGIKYFTSLPGALQRIRVERVNLAPAAREELSERFALVFSGQRRLARNVLRAETTRLFLNDPAAIAATGRIRELAALMRYHLESGDVDAFAACMTEQLGLIKEVDPGATNAFIDYIFDVCDDLVCGKSVCGAGGGGFLQLVLKRGVSREDLAARVEAEMGGCGVRVWDAELYEG